MIYIAHRGNLLGPNSYLENSPKQIELCIEMGYDVEVDIRLIDNNVWLGHDRPTYEINYYWLKNISNKLWLHCKNIEALVWCKDIDMDINYFWHDKDEYILTSKQNIWSYPGSKLNKQTICVLPETVSYYTINDIKSCYGICSDKIQFYKETI